VAREQTALAEFVLEHEGALAITLQDDADDPVLEPGPGTTPLCLEWLDCQDVTGQRVVDYGCGSGILGIVAALKGAEWVICVDNDPQALEATLANAMRNNVADIIDFQTPDEFREAEADIVLANILSGPLIELSPVLLGSLKPGGWIVLSGVLDEQADSVLQAYSRDCIDVKLEAREAWIRLVARKR